MTVVGATAGTAARAKGMACLPGAFMCLALPEELGPHLHRLLLQEGIQAWMAVPITLEVARVGPAARTHVPWSGQPTGWFLL